MQTFRFGPSAGNPVIWRARQRRGLPVFALFACTCRFYLGVSATCLRCTLCIFMVIAFESRGGFDLLGNETPIGLVVKK